MRQAMHSYGYKVSDYKHDSIESIYVRTSQTGFHFKDFKIYL